MKNLQGIFITFEGGEGTGKSTQSKLLYEHLINKNINTILTREPGGCLESEEIRNILIKGNINKWDPITESLLHNAARREHIIKIIKPALLAKSSKNLVALSAAVPKVVPKAEAASSAATAASTALPPCFKISIPTLEAW